jgi:hypothetical protein
MTHPIPNCHTCRTAMEEGFLLDRGHANSADVAKWVEGPPEMGRWLGMNTGIKTKEREMLPVAVYRCPRCGLLESYAR